VFNYTYCRCSTSACKDKETGHSLNGSTASRLAVNSNSCGCEKTNKWIYEIPMLSFASLLFTSFSILTTKMGYGHKNTSKACIISQEAIIYQAWSVTRTLDRRRDMDYETRLRSCLCRGSHEIYPEVVWEALHVGSTYSLSDMRATIILQSNYIRIFTLEGRHKHTGIDNRRRIRGRIRA
jgi:hypothetical protein